MDVNLVMVGKHGWNVDLLVEMPHNHAERNRRLFWLDGVSDEYLEKIYAASDCLVAASEGGSSDLPLIEIAQRKLPIIAHDIPVFRGMAGNHVLHFSGTTPDTLANAMKEWLTLDKADAVPQSDAIPWLTWRRSTQNLLDIVLRGYWYRRWLPNDVHRFTDSNSRLDTQVGRHTRREIVDTRKAGYLISRPHLSLTSGHYQVVIRGELGGTAEAHMDVAADQDQRILTESALREPGAGGYSLVLPIGLDAPYTDLEVRVWINSRTDLSISVVEAAPRLDN